LPPLVQPATELTREEVARYSRHLIIPDLGLDGQKRLKNARVLVIGAGGLGSPALLYLAAAGVGTIGIVEFDVVDESNLQRQIIHGQSDIGRSKAESARDSIKEINPLVDVVLYEVRLEPENAVELFEQYDLILDGTDNFATRYLVNDAAVLAGKPYVWGSIYRFEGQVSVFWEDAPNGLGLNYRDLYPEPPPPGMVPSCGGRRARRPVRVDRVGHGHRGHQADHRHRRSAARQADGLRRARHDLSHHQDPQGSVHFEDHPTDRLRGILRSGVRRRRGGGGRIDHHPARASRVDGLG
jgi:molybdopterin/thiamine biosynthesis adenylyltransferase